MSYEVFMHFSRILMLLPFLLTACYGKQPLYSLEERQFSIATSEAAF